MIKFAEGNKRDQMEETKMAVTETQKAPQSRREAYVARLKKKYPDREYADDEALFGQAGDDYDEYDKQLGEYRARESRLTDLFSKDPRSAQFIADMANGKDPWLAVIERLGIDGVTDLINDPSKQKAYAEANKQYVERLAKEKSLEAEYRKNFASSMDMLERLQQEKGIGDATIDAAMNLIMQMANEAILGKFTEQTVTMALHAVTRDADLQNARAEGEVAGRNAKIDEQLRKPKGGDGQPTLAGSNNAPTRRRSGGQSMFDLADDAR